MRCFTVPVADSSWVVALLYPDDVHHREAWKLFRGEVYVPDVVIGEALTVLSYRYSKERLVEIGSTFLEGVEIVHTNLWEALEFFKGLPRRPKISWIDSIVIMHALRLKEPLLSFDEKQVRVWERLRG